MGRGWLGTPTGANEQPYETVASSHENGNDRRPPNSLPTISESCYLSTVLLPLSFFPVDDEDKGRKRRIQLSTDFFSRFDF